MLGPAKHPAALGAAGAKVWAEIWDVIGPMLAQVMEHGKATRSRDLELHLESQGLSRGGYFSFSYSPIYDERGRGRRRVLPRHRDDREGHRRAAPHDAARSRGAMQRVREREGRLRRGRHGARRERARRAVRADLSRRRRRRDGRARCRRGDRGRRSRRRPRRVALGGADDLWGLGEVVRSGATGHARTVSRRGSPCCRRAPGRSPPHTAMVLPVQLPGQDRPRADSRRRREPDARARRLLPHLLRPRRDADRGRASPTRRRSRQERRRAAALAEIDRAKTAFFSNVSHEFRTPLTLMLGPLEDLLANAMGRCRRDGRRTLTLAHRNSLRLLKLVNSLLDFARIEAGRVEASYEPTDLAAADRGARERVPLGHRARRARARRRLRAARRAGLRRPRHVGEDRAEPSLERVQVHVRGRDQGRAARRAATTSSSRSATRASASPRRTCRSCSSVSTACATRARGRTKAPASVSRSCASSSSSTAATVAVESREGVGTTFTVRLPNGLSSTCRPSESAQRASSRRRGPARSRSSRKRCAGCPDDERERGRGARERAQPGRRGRARARPARRRQRRHARLRAAACSARTTTSWPSATAQQALDAIGARLPDLVLTDVMMPRLDGFGLGGGDSRRRAHAVAARHHAVGARRRGGAHRGSRRRRRRLSRQAVQRARAARPRRRRISRSRTARRARACVALPQRAARDADRGRAVRYLPHRA